MKSEVASQLKSFLDRIERLAAERESLGDDIRAVYAEAKSMGGPQLTTMDSSMPSRKGRSATAEARSKVPKPIDGAPTEDDAEEPVE